MAGPAWPAGSGAVGDFRHICTPDCVLQKARKVEYYGTIPFSEILFISSLLEQNVEYSISQSAYAIGFTWLRGDSKSFCPSTLKLWVTKISLICPIQVLYLVQHQYVRSLLPTSD